MTTNQTVCSGQVGGARHVRQGHGGVQSVQGVWWRVGQGRSGLAAKGERGRQGSRKLSGAGPKASEARVACHLVQRDLK